MRRVTSCIICFIFLIFMLIQGYKSDRNYNPSDTQTEELSTMAEVSLLSDNQIIIDVLTTPEEDIVSQLEADSKMLELITDKQEWFLAYKDILEKYSEVFDKPETLYDIYSEQDISYLQRMVETETYQQDFESKVNVANVALNRLESDKFPNTLTEVIKQKNQFHYSRKEISDDTILACEYAFMISDTTDGCLYFHSQNETATFYQSKYVFTDNSGHHFYK